MKKVMATLLIAFVVGISASDGYACKDAHTGCFVDNRTETKVSKRTLTKFDYIKIIFRNLRLPF